VSKFRIGDRVEILRSDDPEWGNVGEVGTVIWMDGESVEVSGIGATLAAGRGWFHEPSSLRLVTPDPTYTREDLIRVVLGQQWAVAIALEAFAIDEMRYDYYFDETPFAAIGDLPCAVDVVDGKEGV
jgi:hypothetical protein